MVQIITVTTAAWLKTWSLEAPCYAREEMPQGLLRLPECRATSGGCKLFGGTLGLQGKLRRNERRPECSGIEIVLTGWFPQGGFAWLQPLCSWLRSYRLPDHGSFSCSRPKQWWLHGHLADSPTRDRQTRLHPLMKSIKWKLFSSPNLRITSSLKEASVSASMVAWHPTSVS